MSQNTTYISGQKKIDRGYIAECDADFERTLERKVDELCHKKDGRVLGLTGPTCSGKTTAAKKLLAYLGDEQKRVLTVSLDDFFKDTYSRERLKSEDLGKIDFDSPDTLDTELLSQFVDGIFAKGEAEKPIFDFATGTRKEWERVEFDSDDILLFEGIQVLYPSVLSVIENHNGAVMAVRPTSGIVIEGKKYEPNFIRFCRRLVRDQIYRDSGPELTFPMWGNVRANEEKNIFPYMDRCDICIDTTLAYELNILAPYVRGILGEVKQSESYYEKAQDIISEFDGIEGIESDAISAHSLYKEFV